MMTSRPYGTMANEELIRVFINDAASKLAAVTPRKKQINEQIPVRIYRTILPVPRVQVYQGQLDLRANSYCFARSLFRPGHVAWFKADGFLPWL